ncbi:hypothetical protein BC937DRAFT_93978 [Endogone sp. FLAS-F59071]|nr:hypothetical protein BC937DRAFT_93978 [Endogone sp. FLAS-F59071]|eukprot:RUS20957.1 hypothetical protein BC937DRAFT_93978 [Endogone sp. FLAS-F59071]
MTITQHRCVPSYREYPYDRIENHKNVISTKYTTDHRPHHLLRSYSTYPSLSSIPHPMRPFALVAYPSVAREARAECRPASCPRELIR